MRTTGRMKLVFRLILCCWGTISIAQQEVDLDFTIVVKEPRYSNQSDVQVGIDASHNNLHTLEGGFAPFGNLLRADGYQLVSLAKIDELTLKPLKILVIVNALHSSNVGNWKRPIADAFSKNEIDKIEIWVKNGGRLLLIADHMPYAGAANSLAKKFGFNYLDGFVMGSTETWPPESYSKQRGNLFETEITENIDSLAGFTGSALVIPNQAITIARFPLTHRLLIPEVAWQFNDNTTTHPITDVVMGAIMKYGKGKVAIFTEAAMFTAQIVQNRFKVGFNSPRAPQNLQFVLNTIHWLDND